MENTYWSNNRAIVCVLYGFCEGPRIAKPLLQQLHKKGYNLTDNPYAATVVIGHSGGCFLLDDYAAAYQVIMVGLPYWPGKSILRSLIEKNINDFRLHRKDRNVRQWAHKFFWNIVYFWNMPHNLRMLRARKGVLWRKIEGLTLIRNKEDAMCTPDIASIPFKYQPQFIEIPDQHDDIWLHPQRYIAIMEKP